MKIAEQGVREPNQSERAIALGSVLAVIAGVTAVITVTVSGIDPSTLLQMPIAAFGGGVILRAVGVLYTRASIRPALILLGDLGGFSTVVVIAAVVGGLRDPSGSAMLGAVIALGFGLPTVLLASLLGSLAVSKPSLLRVIQGGAFVFGIASVAMYGTTYWSR